MGKFRKKPVAVSVWRFNGTLSDAEHLIRMPGVCFGGSATDGVLQIDTLEGPATAEPGDWIIRGVKGELYPCKPDIFESTYEVVNGRYRKKPVVIDAWQVDASRFVPQPDWLQHAIIAGTVDYHDRAKPYFVIKTLHGRLVASPGDWIIRGVAGELYPCKADIFAETYEAVDE